MNVKYPIAIASLIGLSLGHLAGCATDSNVPFHMYNSPLLEGESQSRFARSRSYDPLKMGDFPDSERVFATNRADSNSDDDVSTNSSSSARATESSGPALAMRTGAPSPRPQRRNERAANHHEPHVVRGSQDPDLAARFIWDIYRLNGVTFGEAARGQLAKLFQDCRAVGTLSHSSRPSAGDIVFFHNTIDRNKDGRNNDWYTHAALVEGLEGSTVTLLGVRSGEVKRFRMNLEVPDATRDRHGRAANSQLRPHRDQDPPFTQYLAGQLFAGTCSALGSRAEFVVIDNWRPSMKLDQDLR